MEIINHNPGIVFSMIELQSISRIEPKYTFLELIDKMEIGHSKRNIETLLTEYQQFIRLILLFEGGALKSIVNLQYVTPIFVHRLLDDLTYVLEQVGEQNEKQEGTLSTLLAFMLSIIQLIGTKQHLNIESQLLRLIKLSLRIAYIPIRKVVLILFTYLHVEFKDDPKGTDKQYQLKQSEYDLIMSKPPRGSIVGNKTEQLYKRLINNCDENIIGQVLVVGLLRALVKTSSSVSPNQQGVDIHREWNDFYQGDLITANYTKYKETTNIQDLRGTGNEVIDEWDRHRIICNFVITEVFILLLKKFRNNCKVQCSYLIQLITDANGVLVLLKFFEKFNPQLITAQKLQIDKHTVSQLLEKCVQNLTHLLFITCNNFPDKIATYLIDYKEYLAIKKFPTMFPQNNKIKKYSYLLLKIQIANFQKNTLKLGNTMKLMTEVYCKYKQTLPPKPDSKLNALYRFEKMQLTDTISSQEDLRAKHQAYNQYQYFNVPVVKKVIHGYQDPDYLLKLQNVTIPADFAQHYEQWLEDNVWDYYD